MQLPNELSITQKSSWFLLQRIRELCNTAGYKIKGEVEIDEIFLSGEEGNKHEIKRLKARGGSVDKAAALVGTQ